MNRSPFALALLAGISLSVAGALYAPTAAARGHVVVGVGIDVAPPSPRFERVPPLRHGYVWTPGYWAWNAPAHRYRWANGVWVQARPGYRYRPAHWVRHRRDWRLQRSHWRR
ncbi:MAG: hypothetical protein ABI767_05695 [Rhodanobacter sp.]